MVFATHLFEWLKFEMHSVNSVIHVGHLPRIPRAAGVACPPCPPCPPCLRHNSVFVFFSKCQTTSCTSQTGSHWATMVIRVKVAIAWFNQMHQTSCMRLCLFVCVSPCEIYSGLCVFESIWNIWFQALLCWPTIGKPTLAPAPQQSHCAVCLSKPKTDMVQH